MLRKRTESGLVAGVRTVFVGRVDSARVHMEIDIEFGDLMKPGPETLTYPTILDFPAPKLSGDRSLKALRPLRGAKNHAALTDASVQSEALV